jgi:acyl carrier protein
MLNLDMDMEADLGIDSIKRVEILGALEEARPDLPTLPSEALAEIRTLEQIVAATAVRTATADRAVTAVRPGTLPATQAVIEGIPSVTVDQVAPAVVGPDATNAADVTQDLLAIVSEKTGYPAEMLDLSMDMEADLGIDSIKRVEIMGALQETHPGLGEIGAEALGELRTLASILDYVTHTSSVMEAAPPKKA